jgi:hypothetical protein
MRNISPAPNIAATIGGQVRVYYADVTTAGLDSMDRHVNSLRINAYGSFRCRGRLDPARHSRAEKDIWVKQ